MVACTQVVSLEMEERGLKGICETELQDVVTNCI